MNRMLLETRPAAPDQGSEDEYLIDSLNEDGLLGCPLARIANCFDTAVPVVEAVSGTISRR